MEILKHSGCVTIYEEQRLKVTKDCLWEFISKPSNLNKITPPHMRFKITNEDIVKDQFYNGLLITYKVHPLAKIPMNWVTEIKNIEEGHYFIDQQLFGPYSLWYHQHIIEAIDAEHCLMKDIVTFKGPLGFLGNWMVHPFLRKEVKKIFEYRHEVLDDIFK